LGSARAGSNPADCETIEIFFHFQKHATLNEQFQNDVLLESEITKLENSS
jgi:hypothetical protein